MNYKRFETEMSVRPDDIDMNNHLHGSKYLDYVLFARYDQMARCYGMAMEDFHKSGWTWYQRVFHIEFKRAISLTDKVIVQTWIDSFDKTDVKVGFQMFKKEPRKLAADGYFISSLIEVNSGKVIQIPELVIQHYVKFRE